MSLSQAERYGLLLTDEQLYREDLAPVRILSDEEEEQTRSRLWVYFEGVFLFLRVRPDLYSLSRV